MPAPTEGPLETSRADADTKDTAASKKSFSAGAADTSCIEDRDSDDDSEEDESHGARWLSVEDGTNLFIGWHSAGVDCAPGSAYIHSCVVVDCSLHRPQSGCTLSPLIVASGYNAATTAAIATRAIITPRAITTTAITTATTRATVAVIAI